METSAGINKAIAQATDGLETDLLDLLDQLVRINSHSLNSEGVKQTAKAVRKALPSGFVLANEPTSEKERIWIFERHAGGNSPVLLLGHIDTVHEPGTFDCGLDVGGEYAHGPGVSDMKGGVAVAVGTLWVLEKAGLLDQLSVTLAVNGDEEVGSPHSRQELERLTKRHRYGLVFERAGKGGSIVTSRRGIFRSELKITGRSGHGGYHRSPKAGALLEMAHRIIEIEGLNDPENGITSNVGVAGGGIAPNIIPPEASLRFDVRFWDESHGQALLAKLDRSFANPATAGVSLRFMDISNRPPMVKTQEIDQLFSIAGNVGRELGIVIEEEARAGSSDANLLAAARLPCLDGFGPEGEFDHTPRERILIKTLRDRVKLTAGMMVQCKKL